MISAVILAGGLGTRLAQTVPNLPKALAPIQGIPFLQLLLRQLEASGLLSKVVLALGHKASSIESFIQTQKGVVSIELSIEPTPLGTGGALLYALDKISDETLLVLNGDTYFDLDFLKFTQFHRARRADITIACRKVDDTSRYGSIISDSSKRIIHFREKSPQAQPGWINGGVYLIEKRILASFAPGCHSIENDFFPVFLKQNFFAFEHEGSFIDIGTPSSYNEAQEILKPWIV